jgi:amidohydrolase
MNTADLDPSLVATLTGWRRHLHSHPEISLHEAETAAFVAKQLSKIGIPFETGIGGHGVVATLTRGASNRSVGLRADMDALPITETTGVAYASTLPGVMHACGHDGHTTSLLGAAALLSREDDWTGTVQFVFQPAEEGFGGARAMLDEGLLERFPMERIFGYHNFPGLAAGTVAVHNGPVMAAGSRILIRLEGHAGHAAMPHLTRDPMLAAAHTLVALQSVVSRSVDPLDAAVVSICMIDGGMASNQIPSEAILRGTFRSQRPEIHAQIGDAIRRIAAGTAAAFGLRGTTEFPTEIPNTANHPAEAELAAETASANGFALRRDLPPSMASEDFGAFLERRPGAFVWIGNGPSDGGRELHNPNYDFNDAILPVAARFLASIAKRSLAT